MDADEQPPVKKLRVGSANEDEEMVVSHARRAVWPSMPMLYAYNGGAFFYERECYDEYYKLIEGRVLAKKRVITVTGTPGIGKSVFYGYFFDRFRREHPDVCVIAVAFYGLQPDTVLVYKGDGREPVRFQQNFPALTAEFMREATKEAYDSQRKLVYLCDGPPDAMYGDSYVVFSSPDEDLMRKTRKFHETDYMPLWSREELYEAARVLDLQIRTPVVGSDLSDSAKRERDREAEIDARFEIFGGVARYCLHPDARAIAHAVTDLDDAIQSVRDVKELVELLVGVSPEWMRKSLLHYEPMQEDRAMHRTKLASPYVVKKLAANMEARYRGKEDYLRDSLSIHPAAAPLFRADPKV